MHTDYKVPFRSEEFLAGVAASCWQITPRRRTHIFDVVALVEILKIHGVEHIITSWGRSKGRLQIELFERQGLWDDPAFVTFNPVTLHVDREIWAKANAGDSDACFIVAHELGHILFHDHDAKAFSIDTSLRIKFAQSREDSAEWQTNTFAGHLLVPTRTVQKFQHHGDVFLAALCNAPIRLVQDRIEAIKRSKKVLRDEAQTDYCLGCGDYGKVTGRLCDDCQKKESSQIPSSNRLLTEGSSLEPLSYPRPEAPKPTGR
jgi:hypothetical protein